MIEGLICILVGSGLGAAIIGLLTCIGAFFGKILCDIVEFIVHLFGM